MKRPAVRARSALLCGLLVFGLLQFGLNVLVETFRPDLVDPEYGQRYRQLQRWQREQPERPLYLVIGSSRPQMGVCPAIVERDDLLLYNFGLAGAGPIGEWFTLNRLLGAGIRPKHVLIEILPPALNCEGDIDQFWHLSRATWHDLETLANRSRSPGSVYADWFQRRAAISYSARRGILNRIAPGFLPAFQREDRTDLRIDPYGWYPYPWPNVDDAFRQLATANVIEAYRVTSLRHFVISEISRWAYRSMLQRLRSEGIGVTLFIMPEGSAFRAAYPPEAWPMIDTFLQELQRDHQVRVINAREWLTDRDFWDGHHLLPDGARRFTLRFSGEVLMPVITTTP